MLQFAYDVISFYFNFLLLYINQIAMMRLSKLTKMLGVASTFLLSHSFCASQPQQYPFAEVIQYRANAPIEDRFCLTQLTAIKAFTASVFDGHGGDLVSQYAAQHLNSFLDSRLANNKHLNLPLQALVERSLIQAYSDVEETFLGIFKANLSNKAYRTVGSCALTAVILKDKLIVANAGDCEGVLLSSKEAAMTNLRLNAGEPFEQARLIREFPDQPDIFVCGAACYLKNRLQPTRSFGDFYLKYKEYNFTKIKHFTGPYLSAVPLITKFQLDPTHHSLLLASDGLWDEMDAAEVHRIYKRARGKLGQAVFERAVEFILERNKLKNREALDKIDYRRDLHDDITILNVDLEKLRTLL